MERELTIPDTAPSPAAPPPAAPAATGRALLAPGAVAGEWRLARPGEAEAARFDDLPAAAEALTTWPGDFALCLPLDCALVQRMTLPSAEPTELAEMARFQLEKVLPYPVETVTTDLRILSTTENEGHVCVTAVAAERMSTLGEPLLARDLWPAQVTLQAFRVASAAAPAEPDAPPSNWLALHAEAGRLLLTLVEAGQPSFVQALPSSELPAAADDLAAALVAAELDGAPSDWSHLALDQGLAEHEGAVAQALGLPVRVFDAHAVPSIPVRAELEPAEWRSEQTRRSRALSLKRVVAWAFIGYVALLVVGLVVAGVIRARVNTLTRRLAEAGPRVAEVQGTIRRWNALAPALDPRLYLLEILLQISESIPTADLRITSLEQSPREILVQGEAPSATLATDLAERLRARPEMAGVRFTADPPQLLPNGRARFRISFALTP